MILPSYFFSPQMEFPDTNFTMILLEILSPHLLIFFWIRCKGQGTSEAPTRVFFTVWNCPSKPVFLSPAPHNQYCCYSREWLLFLKIFVCSPLRFSPFISLDKMLGLAKRSRLLVWSDLLLTLVCPSGAGIPICWVGAQPTCEWAWAQAAGLCDWRALIMQDVRIVKLKWPSVLGFCAGHGRDGLSGVQLSAQLIPKNKN